ncbi:MAG: single-stranded DNA-binding protein [Firmicutes bacterium]|nr:single-stranded DNA-binding protein [Bacillota bacterium]
MLNRIVLIGRLTRDPELRFTQSGVAVCSFTLAVDRNFKSASGERETDFIDIVVWRQQGENCANYLSKGKLAAVDGQLRTRTYETQDGQKRKAFEVVADNVRFLSPKDGGSAPGGVTYGGSGSAGPSVAREPESPFGGDMVGDDDLPF